MDNLYEWFVKKLPHHIDDKTTMIDVGACQGAFSQQFLATGQFTKAHLFEPNIEHYAYLRDRFNENKKVSLYPCAVGSEAGTHIFYCSQDVATGSLLPYHQNYHHESAGKKVQSYSVDVKTLDQLYLEHFPKDKIGLIKIDTQGYDLEVLKGAEQLIKKHKPWLVIELNFMSFYNGQASIPSILNWLSQCGYGLGGLFNDYYSNDDWLGFADGVFVPEGTVAKVVEPFHLRAPTDLIAENKFLRDACEERLHIINALKDKNPFNRVKRALHNKIKRGLTALSR